MSESTDIIKSLNLVKKKCLVNFSFYDMQNLPFKGKVLEIKTITHKRLFLNKPYLVEVKR